MVNILVNGESKYDRKKRNKKKEKKKKNRDSERNDGNSRRKISLK